MQHESEGRVATHAFPLSVARLVLTEFRNYTSLSLETDAEPVVITGENGAGKTNILEAISLLTPGRGLRGAKTDAFGRRSGNTPKGNLWAVNGIVRNKDIEITLGTGLDPNSTSERRMVKINGEKQRGQASLLDYFAVCSLTPQMDQTFSEGTSSRRYYLDQLTQLFAADHTKHLAIYEQAKSERRKLLEGRSADTTWISALEARMAEHAVSIAANRGDAISQLQTAINASSGGFPKADLAIQGHIEAALAESTALAAEEMFKEKLQSTRTEDLHTGKTTFGTHRSDFIVTHRKKEMTAEFCSTGEQKALLLSITLACARAKAAWSNVVPVLLLDEVIAHLDAEKRAALFEEIRALSAQSWMTGTDDAFFSDFRGSARFLRLENYKLIG
jgi:DNA replication and repair protein RecF